MNEENIVDQGSGLTPSVNVSVVPSLEVDNPIQSREPGQSWSIREGNVTTTIDHNPLRGEYGAHCGRIWTAILLCLKQVTTP